MEQKTKEQWVASYQGMSEMHLQFFLLSAKGLLKSDRECLAECEPNKRQYWQQCVEQDTLEIEVIEEQLAQQPAN